MVLRKVQSFGGILRYTQIITYTEESQSVFS